MKNLARVYADTDASLIEINPFTLTGDGLLFALDGKMNFDDNGLFRRPDIAALRDWDEKTRLRLKRPNTIFHIFLWAAISVAWLMARDWRWRRWTS